MCRECKGLCPRFSTKLPLRSGYMTHNLCRTCSDFRNLVWVPKDMLWCKCCKSMTRTKAKGKIRG